MNDWTVLYDKCFGKAMVVCSLWAFSSMTAIALR